MKLFGLLKTIIIVIFLLFSFALNAHIIYRDIHPDRTLSQGQFQFIDLTGDGLNDIVISIGFNQETFLAVTAPTVGSIGASSVEVLSQNQLIRKLNSGFFIDANAGNFIQGSSTTCLSCIKNQGEWVGGANDVFIAFRFTNIATNTLHYAWIRLSINSILSEFTIKEVAYETEANVGIYTGFVPISSINIQGQNGESVIATDNGQLQMQAQISPSYATQQILSWSVDNVALASIDNNGLITALADGNVLITARTQDGTNLQDTFRVYMSNQIVPVAQIEVFAQNNNAQISMLAGTLQMNATLLPSFATNQQVVWSVDDLALASIDNNGLLTAKNNGLVKVIATAADGSRISGYKDVNITGQPNLINSITIQGGTEITSPFGTLQLQNTIVPFQNNPPLVHWSVNDNSLASINANGLLRAHKNGTVIVKATLQDGSNLSATWQVQLSNQWQSIQSIQVNGQGQVNSISIEKGVLQMLANISPNTASNQNIKWSVNDESIATISANGLLSALKNGIVTVRAVAQDGSGIIGQENIIISNQYEYVQSLSLSTANNSNTINIPGASLQILANFLPTTATNQQLYWKVNDNSKAYINQSGLLTAFANGVVQVTAITQDGSAVSANLNVTISNQNAIVQNLELTTANNIRTISIPNGQLQITPVFTPTLVNNSALIWTVDNENNAIVNANGLVTALRNGSVTVRATTQDGTGISAAISIVLSNQPVLMTTMSILSSSNTINRAKDTLNLSLNYLPANATNTNAIWISNRPNIATVNNQGVLTAVSNGSVIITAVAQDGSGQTITKNFTITNQWIQATAINIQSRNAITINEDTLQCIANFTPTVVSNPIVYWSVNDENIATISPNGLLKAKTNGSVIVQAQTKDGSNLTVTKSINISNQEVYVSNLQITARTTNINVKSDTLQLHLATLPANTTTTDFVWRCSDESLATVSNTGLVTAYKDGVVTITAVALDAGQAHANYVITLSNQHKLITALTSTQANQGINIPNGILQMTVAHTPLSQTAPIIYWSVDNPALATITPNGKLHAIANGTVNVKALAMDGSNQQINIPIQITNQKIQATQLSLSARTNTINASKDTLQINANVIPSNVTLQQLAWQVDNPNIAQVSQLGLLTAYANGTVVVTAKTLDASNIIATYTVHITGQNNITTAISLNTNTGNNAINTANGTLQMSATVSPSYVPIKWTVNDTSIASIDANGLLKAKKNGNVTVQVKALDGSNVQSSYTVVISNQPIHVQSIILTSETGLFAINSAATTLRILAQILPSNAVNHNVTWSIRAGTGWASISNTGVITPIHNGTVFVRATSNYDTNIYAEEIVSISYQTTSAPSISTLTLSSSSTSINTVNGTMQINPTITPISAKRDLIWEVSNVNLASINEVGRLTALANGTVTVTAYSLENPTIRATRIISINNQLVAVNSFEIRSTTGITNINTLNGSLQLEAHNFLPNYAAIPSIKWKVNNPNLAIIDDNGLLRAFGNGIVEVTAYAQDTNEFSASINVTITNQYTSVSSISVTTNTINLSSQWQNATIIATPSSATYTYLKYTSSDPSIVSVNQQGGLQAWKNGTAQITIQAQDFSAFSRTITVNVTNQVLLSTGIDIVAASNAISFEKGVLQLNINHNNTPSLSTVLWRVSDESVAKVSNKGLVTAIKNASVYVYAYAQDRSNKIDSFQVQITNQKNAITAINIIGDSQINTAWQPTLYTYTLLPNANTFSQVAWSVNDTSLAIVTANGMLIPKKNGSIVLTAKAKDASNILATKTIEITGQKVLSTAIQFANNTTSINAHAASANINFTMLPTNVTTTNLYYKVADTSIISVNAYGMITAIKNGQSVVDIYTIDESNIRQQITVNVSGQYAPVNSISIQSANNSLAINVPNESLQFTAIAQPQHAPWLSFAWTCSNNNIATITPSGLLIAKQNGTVTITAKAQDGSNTMQSVTVLISNQNIRAQSIILSTINNIRTINTPNGTLVINAAVTPNNASSTVVGWEVNNTAIARINTSGMLTALSNGTVLVTARTLDGSNLTNTYTVTISNQSFTNVTLAIQGANNINTISIPRGTLAMQAIFSPANPIYNNIAWTSSDINIATINYQGIVTAKKNGNVVITGRTLDGNSTVATKAITITNQPELVSNIQLQAPNGTLNLNTPFDVKNIPSQVNNATAANRVLKWYASDSSMVSIDASGQLRAFKNGAVKIYALATDGSNIKDSLQFQISNQNIYLQSLQLQSATGSNSINTNLGTLQINILQQPSIISNQHLHWSVDNEQLASISQNGLLTAKRNGIVRVRASMQDASGVYADLLIDITNQSNNAVVLVEEIDVFTQNGLSTISMPSGTLQLYANVFPQQANNQQITWSISNKNYGMINAQGLFTAWGDGTVLVFATSQDGSNVSGIYALELSNQPNVVSIENVPVSVIKNLQVYPNPFIDYIEISMFLEKGVRLNAYVVDIQGRVLKQTHFDCTEGQQTQRLNLNDLVNAAVYILYLQEASGAIQTFKLIKY